MGDICLSVAPILRCQSLSRLEAGILLLPPGLEIIFASVLLWVKRGSDKKHVFIAAEVFVYFFLAVLDVLTHTLPNIGHSLDTFRSLDVFVGVASFIPLFLYTFALYLLTTTELIPSLPVRFQNIAKYVLIAFIPLIILLNELGSFVGITYRSFPDGLGVGFTDANTKMFLGSVTLVLLTAFQACNFCIAFYRLVKALSHQRSLDATQREKEMEAHLFRGLGWIVAGTKLGAIETVIGFAQGRFGVAFTRRLLRLLGHGCLIIGLVKGLDTVEDFQLYSPGEAQKRRKSTLRAMIQNPRFSTFRHVGGHDFDKQNPFDEKHNSVIKLGDPSWMRRDHTKPAAVDEEERVTPGLLSTTRKSSSLTFQLATRPSVARKPVRDSVSTMSSKRSSWPYAARDESVYDDEYADVQEDAEEIDDVTQSNPVPRVPLPPRAARQRVTVHIGPDRLPVLQLRRVSNLEFLDLVQDPFRDPHMRARSLPGNLAPSELTRPGLPAFPKPASLAEAPTYIRPGVVGLPSSVRVARTPSPAPPVRDSVASRQSRDSRAASFTTYDRPWSGVVPAKTSPTPSKRVSVGSANALTNRASVLSYDDESEPPSATSFHAIGSPQTITSWVSPGSRIPSSLAAGAAPLLGVDGLKRVSRRERGLSSSTTASEVHALAMQFPTIPAPPRPFAPVPARRSMLSHEIPRTEFIAGPVYDEPESVPELPPPSDVVPPMPEPVARIPSVKRKPAPLMTEGLVDQRLSDVEIVQVVDDDVAVRSLPTPQSAPRYSRSTAATLRTVASRAHRNAHDESRADVPLSASAEDDEFEADPQASADFMEMDVNAEDRDSQEVEVVDAPKEVQAVRSAALARRRSVEQGQLMRVKSVGSAPMRTVSSAHRQAFARDSIKVELGHIAREGKLQAVVAGRAF